MDDPRAGRRTIAGTVCYIKYEVMKKFQVTIKFEFNDEFAALVPEHRSYVSKLIKQGVIDHYAVTMETQMLWITISAEDKAAVENHLFKSPLFKFWTYEINELFVVDGLHYRLPVMQLN
jgi:L-rhamnose mutarotase